VSEDPGSWKAIRAIPAGISPQLSRPLLKGQTSLVVYRGMILGAIVASYLLYAVLTAISHGVTATGKTSPLLFVFLGFFVVDIPTIIRFRNRPFWVRAGKAGVPSDVLELAVRYRAHFMLSWALTNALVLYGFVAFFVVTKHKLAIYLAAAIVGSIGMIFIAPTRKRIEGQAGQLARAGSQLSLRDALMISYGDLPRSNRSPRK
jgi:hypothetical protein